MKGKPKPTPLETGTGKQQDDNIDDLGRKGGLETGAARADQAVEASRLSRS